MSINTIRRWILIHNNVNIYIYRINDDKFMNTLKLIIKYKASKYNISDVTRIFKR